MVTSVGPKPSRRPRFHRLPFQFTSVIISAAGKTSPLLLSRELIGPNYADEASLLHSLGSPYSHESQYFLPGPSGKNSMIIVRCEY